MGVFSRSWQIAKVSFKMIKEEKELLVFPILSSLFLIIFFLLMVIPYLMSFIVSEFTEVPSLDALFYFIAFVLYFGFAFIATFFNVCVVYTAAIKFSKGNPKFGSTIKYAFSKIHLIFLWSIVSATIGLFFMILENIANKMKSAGKIILLVVRGLLGVAWSLITIFVIPAMVYHNLGPFKAIKKSAGVFKKTWGEYFVKSFGMGIIAFLFIILGSLMFIALIIVSFISGIGLMALIFILLWIFYIIIIALIFGVASKVFNTALYAYAETGQVVGEYSEDMLKNAFKAKENKGILMPK